MSPRRSIADGRRIRLHHVVSGGSFYAVVVRPPIDLWNLAGPIAVGGRRRRRPLQAGGAPWVHVRLLALEGAPEEVDEENHLRRAQDERADGDELVERSGVLQELVLVGIVDTAQVARDAYVMHGEKRAVVGDEREPEVPLAEGLVHHPAEHLGEPERGGSEDTEEGRAR